MLAAALAVEARVMTEGLLHLPLQSQLLLRVRAGPLNSPLRQRFAARAQRDALVALPWVPILGLLPGSVALFSACSTLAPALLPSTFAIARARCTQAGAPLEHAAWPLAAMGKRPLGKREACNAPAASVLAALPQGGRAALEFACKVPPAALASHVDSLALDDILLEEEGLLKTGVFDSTVDPTELQSTLHARCLRSSSASIDKQLATLRSYLLLRRVHPAASLLFAFSQCTDSAD
jgi:hypothetical protein